MTIKTRLTPLDSAYPSCERTCANLCLFCGEDNPNEITDFLRVSPSAVSVLGREVTNSYGKPRRETKNAWFLKSEHEVKSKDLREHLDWILARLLPVKEKFAALHERENYSMRVFCPWWAQEGSGGPALWPEQMRGLADLNLELCFDFAYYGDEEE